MRASAKGTARAADRKRDALVLPCAISGWKRQHHDGGGAVVGHRVSMIEPRFMPSGPTRQMPMPPVCRPSAAWDDVPVLRRGKGAGSPQAGVGHQRSEPIQLRETQDRELFSGRSRSAGRPVERPTRPRAPDLPAGGVCVDGLGVGRAGPLRISTRAGPRPGTHSPRPAPSNRITACSRLVSASARARRAAATVAAHPRQIARLCRRTGGGRPLSSGHLSPSIIAKGRRSLWVLNVFDRVGDERAGP